ncbi:hypothetical protein ACIQ7D_30000 [Streptomyces sp. NPDC096310]|uniref:hypothetical protein n=1 Tax=Streptomyces sp. NPDC096310 TaxID=3366082 RepID=UPI00382E5634
MASWAGVCPGDHQSGDRQDPARRPLAQDGPWSARRFCRAHQGHLPRRPNTGASSPAGSRREPWSLWSAQLSPPFSGEHGSPSTGGATPVITLRCRGW